MRTSSDVDYAPLCPKAAPQYLRDWAKDREWSNQALIWRVGWYREPLTGLKRRCAEAYCTACGRRMLLDYVSGGSCHGSGYGPTLFLDGKAVLNWSNTKCPECGAQARSEHVSGSDVYAGEYAYPMTLHRAKRADAPDLLILAFWQVEKTHGKDGSRRFAYMPWEAYVVEEKRIVRLTHHGATVGGGSYDLGMWKQTVRFTDSIRDIYWTVCPEGIAAATAGTTAENSKLELYMKDGAICFPVSWLRIWQKHANAENLLTCGAGGIVANLIGQEKTESRSGYRQAYGSAIPRLACVDWRETRPGRMLGMDRGELRAAVETQRRLNLGGQTWSVWLSARRAGSGWTLEDAAALEGLERKERVAEQKERPSRIRHYLGVQRRRWENDKPGVTMLLDYWDMLRKRSPEPWNAEERWPERLKLAHDRLVRERKAEANRALNARIAARAEKLDAWEYHFGGLFITPPRTALDLYDEGEALHHCVESYSQRHADGGTTILFIRREAAPDKPYFTLEWREEDGQVMQNRGNRNCERTPEVEAFEKAWVDWMRRGRPKKKEAKTA